MGQEIPDKGFNYSGEWFTGKKEGGIEISPSHKNARYTLKIDELKNADKNLNNPDGVEISGFIYGGRDSDTNVPVLQSLNWQHGVFLGSIIESETTSASIGKEGIRKHNPMSNIEFLVVPLSTYIKNHLKFGKNVKKQPLIFTTNYFIKENDEFLNDKMDKKVWLMWMEGRVHNDFEAIQTPIGLIPKYEDLKDLFKEFLSKDYSKEDYEKQFSIRTENHLEKLDRVETIFKEEENIPEEFFTLLNEQRERLSS